MSDVLTIEIDEDVLEIENVMDVLEIDLADVGPRGPSAVPVGVVSGNIAIFGAVTLADSGLAPDDFEPALGNPATDGMVLTSTAAGTRSWQPDAGGLSQAQVLARTMGA